MSASLNTLTALPLHSLRVLEKPLDWTSLWESWARQGPAVLLESAGPMGDASQWVILAGGASWEALGEKGKCYLISSDQKTVYEPGFWSLLDEMCKNEDSFKPFPHGLAQSWFGLLSYEFGHGFVVQQTDPVNKTSVPDFYFFKPSQILAFNRQTKEIYQFGDSSLDPEEINGTKLGSFQVGPVEASISAEQYESHVRKAQDYIAAGDIYQANLAQSFQASWKGSAATLYGSVPGTKLYSGFFLTRKIDRGPGRLVGSAAHRGYQASGGE